MATKKKPLVSRRIAVKAKEVLKFAENRVRQAADWVELHNALYGLGGKATVLFATEGERTAFCKTPEYRRISQLMDTLPPPTRKGLCGADIYGKRRNQRAVASLRACRFTCRGASRRSQLEPALRVEISGTASGSRVAGGKIAGL